MPTSTSFGHATQPAQWKFAGDSQEAHEGKPGAYGTARKRYAVAVQPTFNRTLSVEDALVRATGAAERIGSAGSPMFGGPLARRQFTGTALTLKAGLDLPREVGPALRVERAGHGWWPR